MADLEDVTLDGRPLQSLRVADLKAALEERGLSKSGQKNALVKRLKGALMLENLQKTSTAHIGLQPNSQIGEEMSQNSFIKQYLAKQQELLRQRLEREAREVYDTNEQKDHAEVNNSTSCPPPAQQDVAPLAEPQKPAGPSGGVNDGESNKNKENDSSGPPASGSVTMRVPGGEHRPERGSTSSDVAPDSDDEDSEDGEEDADDDDWDSGARRRNVREPARAPPTRQRSGASCQPQQQHIPSLLSPQLRQPTPPPSPPPELSFPLPDTPKQSPPSPDVAPGRRSPSSSSSGSSSSGSRSSSPEPERGGPSERKPGPLTLLARKMESEGAFSGAAWHGGNGEGNRQDSKSQTAASFFGKGPPDGQGSAITHTGNVAFPIIPGTDQSVTGAHSGHIQVPAVVFKATKKGDNVSEAEREAALEMERLDKQRKYEQQRAMELEHERALALELEERQRALERERQMKQQALEREEQEKALQRERELALERERQERELALEREQQELALAKEREKVLAQERALELERQREVERQRALEEERLQRERVEMQKALELERQARERALEQERLERERALEAERRERERIAREMALEQERLEKVRLEQERVEREKALEKERLEMERALERERIEKEMALERERIEREKALEQERLEKERLEKERALEQERLEKEKLEKERALEQERLEKERALEQERLEKERLEKERAVEQERLEKERAIEQKRLEKERALEQERLEKELALEQEWKEKERIERERLEQERIDKEKALEREREEKARAAALEEKRKEKEKAEKEERARLEREMALEQERLEMERTLEKERVERERALEDKRGKAIEQERLEREEAVRNEKKERERELSSLAEKGRQSDSVSSKSGQEVGLTTLSTPTTPTSEPDRKPLSEDVQEVVPAPLFHGALPSQTLLSPQSPFKKSRFFRDSPIQPPPSSTSVVIMRPTPRPESSSVLSPTSVGEQQHEAQHRSAKHEDPQMQTKMDAAGSIGIQSQQTGLGKTEHHAVATTEKVQEVDERQNQSAQRREGRSVEKEEKPTRQRSSSNESSSSESESGSSSSGSSRSSDSSSSEKPFISRSRREANSRTDSSPEPMVTDEVSNDIPKASPRKRDRSRDDDNTTVDGERPTKKPFTEAPSQDEKQRQRTYSGQEEETDKPRPVKETAMAEPEKTPENNEETPKTFSARKISLSNNKLSPGGSGVEGEQESGAAAGRKRRWGSSTAVTAKKPSISITTDSLKSLIPDIRPCLGQEAVVDLHPEEAVLSGIEDEERERSDQDLQIRRTVTQVVHPESQENGQKETKRSRLEELEEEDQAAEVEITRAHEEKMETSFTEAGETQSPSRTSHDAGNSTVTPSDTLIRRSISQQKTGVSITIDDPVRTTRQPSPPRGKVSNIVHVCNLVRPFTLGQLKELLSRTGTLVDDGFWIDKIKSHCYVTYSSSEEAVATRAALHGVKWPQSNPKLLSVDFCLQEELDFHKTMGERPDKPGAEEQGPGRGRTAALPPLLPERDQWAEREREMERREKGRAEREWDRDKVREFEKLGAEKEGASRRSRSRERRRKERGKSKEKKSEKKEKPEDPPAKLLDDLFRKTKAAPCIYWLPLTDEQYVQRQADRVERQKEREKRRKELEEEEEKKREEERKERMKTAGGAAGDRSEGEKDKDRERERDKDRGRDRERERERENDKRRDGYRRPGGSTTGGSRRSRSRSRSDPRDRRR